MIKKIYFDLDGVLADFQWQVQAKFSIKDIGQFIKDNSQSAFWSKLTKAGEEFWSSMPQTKHGWDLVVWAIKNQIPYEILTAPTRDKSSRTGKAKWVKQNVNSKTAVNFAAAHKKQEFAAPGMVLIDDKPETIDQWNAAGGIGLLYKDSEYKKTLAELDKLQKHAVNEMLSFEEFATRFK